MPIGGARAFDIRVALALFFVGWAAYGILSVYPGYVHQDTAEVSMWSQIGFEVGFVKHPPFLPWLFRAVDFVVPLDSVTISLLAAANLTAGAWAVWCIARRTIGQERAVLALAFYWLLPFVTWQAIKLNHNSILVSLWPIAILYFLKFRDKPTLRRAVVLGLVSALAVLAKYYSVVLLGAMGLLLLGPALPRLARTQVAWIGVAVFVLTLLPHALWYLSAGAGSAATGRGSSEVDGSTFKMLMTNVAYCLPLVIGYVVMRYWPWRSQKPEPGMGSVDADDYIAVVGFFVIPYLATMAACSLLGLRASHSWTMPIFTMLPIILAGTLPAPDAVDRRQLTSFMVAATVAALIAGPLVRYASFKWREPSAVEPRTEIISAAEELWRRAVPTPLRVVGGTHHYAVTASVVVPGHPRAWSNFSRLSYLPRSAIARDGFIAICAEHETGCRQMALDAAAGEPTLTREVRRRRTLWGLTGPEFKVDIVFVAPAGSPATLWSGVSCPTFD